MINYKLRYGVSEVARILGVEKELVKNWAYHFADYLNPKANPNKGIEREFSADDLCTLGYISMYWEETPDFEHIKYGLNSNNQFEYPFSEISIQETPIFREFSDELLGGKVWMIGGITEINDKLTLADSYKVAGDILINFGIENEDNKEFIYPAIFNYRHATELYIKALIVDHKENHNLLSLYSQLKDLIFTRFKTVPPKWFENIIISFHDFDPGGTTFRYGIRTERDEMFIDLPHIKKLMDWFSESIHLIEKREIEKE